MSTLPSSRWSRASTRTRGGDRENVQGGSRGRPASQQHVRGAGSGASQGNSSQKFSKPTLHPREQANARDRKGVSPRPKGNPQANEVSSAILSHAGPILATKDQPWRNAAEQDKTSYKQRMSDLYQKLKERRERERKQAIKDGFLADPERPRSLANAITPVGTCQDMCPEFERVERIVQLMVDASEKIPSTSDAGVKVPSEELMVKRFRRSAAGYDEQLPSDIRPPRVLQQTLNHLFESVVGGPEPLANTHKFVWDRTRGIRNDFSIQQVTRIGDLIIAIDCFERIARFHILSLHQLSHQTRDNGEFDQHQEREQLNNTLLSLMYYYDDSRGKLVSPNEAEFRAYCIIFEMQDQRPDLEDRAQNWRTAILRDPRVMTALKLYAAAGNTSDDQGPLRPRTTFSTAQTNTRGFFDLVQSNSVPYMMACVAEIYFNLVRSTALETIWTAYRKRRPGSAVAEDWGMDDLTFALGFDYRDQTRTFCEEHGFEIGQRDDGEDYLNLGSVTGQTLTDHNPRRKQIFSEHIVENKRLGRSFPAVINGLSFLDAKAKGLVTETDTHSVLSDEPLFLNGDSDGELSHGRSRSGSPHSTASRKATEVNNVNGNINPFKPISNNDTSSSKFNPFKTSTSAQSQPVPAFTTNPVPSTTSQAFNPFAPREPPKSGLSETSSQKKTVTTSAPSLSDEGGVPKFDFIKPSTQQPTNKTTAPSPFSNGGAPKFDFTNPSGQQPKPTTPTASPFNNSNVPKFDFNNPSSQQPKPGTPALSSSGNGTTPKFDFKNPSGQQPSTKIPASSAFDKDSAPKSDSLTAITKKPDERNTEENCSTNGEQTPSTSAIFGASSVKSTTEGAQESVSILGSSNRTDKTHFAWNFPAAFPQKPPNPEHSSNSDLEKVKFDSRSDSPKSVLTSKPSEQTSKFSFATSPLFQPATKETRNDKQPLLSKPTSSSEATSSDRTTIFQPPGLTSSAPENSLSKAALSGPADVSKASSKSIPNLISKAPATNISPAHGFSTSKTSHSPTPAPEVVAPHSTSGGQAPAPSFSPSSFTSSPQQQPQFTVSASAPKPSSTSFQPSTFGLSQQESSAPTETAPDPRHAALDEVTDGLMFDEGGLLQQYIEISIAPIMKSAIAQFENEESWKVAREYRLILLSKKYLRKWKKSAWNLGIMRRGRHRRQNFARSIQSLARTRKEREQEEARSSIFNVDATPDLRQKSMAREKDASLSATPSPQKRQSLPAGIRVEMSGAIQTPRNSKRKLDESESVDDGRTFPPHVSGHKRSNTVDSSLHASLRPSAPSNLHSQPPKSAETSNSAEVSRFSSKKITKDVRRIAANTYSDTTQTDYFRLKALGVNPDTPIVPLTKTRAIQNEGNTGVFRTPDRPASARHNKSRDSKQRSSNKPIKTDISASKDDDDFFASIRAIRSTLADSTAWFQSERQSIERSMTPSRASVSPSSGKQETPAERRLREIKEKGHTPSRSEVRLRAMGDKSLLPASFWDDHRQEETSRDRQKGKRKSDDWGSGNGATGGKKRRVSASEDAGIGFAALVNQQSPYNSEEGFSGFEDEWTPQNGIANGISQYGNGQNGEFQQDNGNMNDVIELSD